MKVLFVHGALVGDGQWWWHRMVEPLARRGLSTGAVVLPSCSEVPGELGDMYADAAAVSEAVRAAGEPVILCGHSYGGTVITEAGAGAPNVRHLIYITSVLADLGQSHADAVGAGPAPWVHPQSDGTAVLRSEQLQGLFFQDCDDGTFAEALTRATPQSVVASSTQRADRPLAAAQVTRRWQPQLRDDGTGQVVRRPNRRAGWAGRPAG